MLSNFSCEWFSKRMENNVMRKDMFQLLLQLRNGGDALQDDDWEMQNRTNGKFYFA